MRFPGFIGAAYSLQSVNVDCQRCVNLYPEIDEMRTGKNQEIGALIGRQGLRLLCSIGSGPIRGLYRTTTGRFYCVSGNALYEVNSSWASSYVGDLWTSEGVVSMSDNGQQLCVVDGTYGYITSLSNNSFARITDPDFYSADKVSFLDGYFIFNRKGTGQFFISALYDGSSEDPLDFATAEGSADELVSQLVNNRELWNFGSRTTEVWYNTGAPDFPLSRIQGAFIEYGCNARHSVVKIDNTVIWLGEGEHGVGTVWKAAGYQPQRASTHAVEHALKGYGDLSEAYAWAYEDGGHRFYCLQVPGAPSTWCYDTSTGLWHERTTRNTTTGLEDRFRASCHAFAFGRHVVGDYQNGNLYALDSDYYSDNGVEITALRTSPHINVNLKRLFVRRFQLDMEFGVGLDGTAQGTDPQAMIQISTDNGHSWSNEYWASAGKIGERRCRAIWRRLGSGRDVVMRVKITDPIKRTLIGAEIDIEEGAN